MRLRHRLFVELVCSHVAEPLARILEVGCGRGEAALALAERGYEVTASDPEAPDGPIFRRVSLEDFSDERGFDAVIAAASLHHLHDLREGLDKIASLLPADGPLVIEEFARERITGATAHWYYAQRRALVEAGRAESEVPDTFDEWERRSLDDRAHLHSVATIRAELEPRFAERLLEWRPFLYSWRLDDTLEPLERRLIDEDAIAATGLWYVGHRT
jgi:SAM-dependent methyltransferase